MTNKLSLPADVQRWSEEVARDPASPAFLPLAQAYRRQGRREAAIQLCLRGLERNPVHVAAHTLLARLYLEAGERDRAADEWATVLRLEPDNFEALRGMGFFSLERGDADAARRYLERAAALRPDDPAVREARTVLRDRFTSPGPAPAPRPEPPRPAPPAPPPAVSGDPARLFEPLRGDGPFLGALVLDGRGLVLAGTLVDGGMARAEALGAVLGGAVDEAARTAEQLALGTWEGALVETPDAILHLTPLGPGLVLLLAARREAPAGWVVHAAGRAAGLARTFLEGPHA